MLRHLPATFAAITFALSASAATAASLSKSDVESIVKKYIQDNPEVVVDSLKAYQMKKAEEAQKNAKKAIVEKEKELRSGSPVFGNPKGNVTIVEFYDFHCGYCKKMLPVITDLVKSDPEVRIVMKDFPILSADSAVAAKASIAFYKLNPKKYMDFYAAMMGAQGGYTQDSVGEIAKKFDVSPEKLKKEMESKATEEQLNKNQALARDLNISGTPAFILGSELLPGAVSLEDLKARVEAARKGKASSS